MFGAFCKENVPEAYSAENYDIGPDVDFAAMPELHSVLKATDCKSMVARMNWLVDNYWENADARLYLKKRQEYCF